MRTLARASTSRPPPRRRTTTRPPPPRRTTPTTPTPLGRRRNSSSLPCWRRSRLLRRASSRASSACTASSRRVKILRRLGFSEFPVFRLTTRGSIRRLCAGSAGARSARDARTGFPPYHRARSTRVLSGISLPSGLTDGVIPNTACRSMSKSLLILVLDGMVYGYVIKFLHKFSCPATECFLAFTQAFSELVIIASFNAKLVFIPCVKDAAQRQCCKMIYMNIPGKSDGTVFQKVEAVIHFDGDTKALHQWDQQEVLDGRNVDPGRRRQFIGLLLHLEPTRHDSAETMWRVINLCVNVGIITGLHGDSDNDHGTLHYQASINGLLGILPAEVIVSSSKELEMLLVPLILPVHCVPNRSVDGVVSHAKLESAKPRVRLMFDNDRGTPLFQASVTVQIRGKDGSAERVPLDSHEGT